MNKSAEYFLEESMTLQSDVDVNTRTRTKKSGSQQTVKERPGDKFVAFTCLYTTVYDNNLGKKRYF